jgi:hypothetical protein
VTLPSERVIIAAPMSFAGSAQRIWPLAHARPEPWAAGMLGTLAVLLILLAWAFIAAWYLLWWFWLVPYRLIRRGQRKREREALQHREVLAAIEAREQEER